VRQHNAALLLRDTSRVFFTKQDPTLLKKNKPTARDMSRNYKAATCCRTPKGACFSMRACWG
jgi:hypothetical protein